MKWIVGFFLLVILAALTCCESRAATDEPVMSPIATETITLSKGMTLWGIASAQKLPRRDWQAYWKDTCTLSRIACTDDAWKKLSVGTVITVPRDLRVVLAERQSELSALKSEVAQMEQGLVDLRQSLTELKKEQTELHTVPPLFWIVLGINGILIVAFMGMTGTMMEKMKDLESRVKSEKTTNGNACEVTEGPHCLFTPPTSGPPPINTPPPETAYRG